MFALLLFIVLQVPRANLHTVTLSWSAGVGGDRASGFTVKRAANPSGPFAPVGSTTGTRYVDQVSTGTYYYEVTAFNVGGESAPSNQVLCSVLVSSSLRPCSVLP